MSEASERAQALRRNLSTAARQDLPSLTAKPIIGTIFYSLVLTWALVGGAQAATVWLAWPIVFAALAVLTGELGGVYLLEMADQRQRLGENAYGPRLLSVVVAFGMAYLNWVGHHGPARFLFAGFSTVGYLIWMFKSGARRRDQLRADGRLPEPAPRYGLLRWLQHPWETARARGIAREELLGLFESVRQARLRKRMSAWVKLRLKKSQDKEMAQAIVTIYDADRLAMDLVAKVDWDGLSTALAKEMDPTRVLAVSRGQKAGRASEVEEIPTSVPVQQRRPVDRDSLPQQIIDLALRVGREVHERTGRVVTRDELRSGIRRAGGPGVSNVTVTTLLELIREDLGVPSVNGAVTH